MADSAIFLQRLESVVERQRFAPLTPEARAENLRQPMQGRAGEIWVFAYGSLIWQPAFRVAERRKARLAGYRRSFCLWSALARGTPNTPGLGLGVIEDRSSVCDGIALRVEETGRLEQLAALWDREMWTDAYNPIWEPLDTNEGRIVALVFEANKDSRQFVGGLSDRETAQIIARARGKFGTCREYLERTDKALQQTGIVCPDISRVRDALPLGKAVR